MAQASIQIGFSYLSRHSPYVMSFLFLGRCCQSTAEDANTVLDLSALEEHTPTLLTQSVKQSGELTNDDKGRSTNSSIDDMMQQASRSTVLPSGSPDDES